MRVWVPTDPNDNDLVDNATYVRTAHNKGYEHIIEMIAQQARGSEEVYDQAA